MSNITNANILYEEFSSKMRGIGPITKENMGK